MILRRFIKSWRGVIILLLSLFSLFCMVLVYSSMTTQWMAQEELKADTIKFVDFYQCLYHSSGIEYDGKTYLSGDDYKKCVDELLANKPKFMETK